MPSWSTLRVAAATCWLVTLGIATTSWAQDVPKMTRPPELVEGAEPVYPPEAAAAGREASVTVRVRIDDRGRVIGAEVLVPVGGGFDEAAVAATRKYRFRPAEYDGKPGPSTVDTTLHFRITTEEVEVEEEQVVDDGEPAEVFTDEDYAQSEITVKARRQKRAATQRTITRRQMTSVPGTFGDPLRVVQNLPGMARSPYATGLLLVRGTNPDDTGVFVDGHEVPLLYHFLGGPSILNPEFLERIDLYPGGYPGRFGRQGAGVVSVDTRPSKSDGFHGSAEVDVIDSGAYARYDLTDDVSVAVAGRRSYIDALLPWILPEPDPGDQLVVVPVYWDYQARMDATLGPGERLTLMVFGSDDRLDVLQVDAEDEETLDLGLHIGFHRVQLTYERPLGRSGLVLSLSPAFGYDLVTAGAGARSSADVRQKVVNLRERVSGNVRPGLFVDVGFDMEVRLRSFDLVAALEDEMPTGTGEDPELPVENILREVGSYALGMYGEVAWDLGRWQLVPALRVDAYVLAGEPRLGVDPRMVARYQVQEGTSLKAYAGVFHQPPEAEGLDERFGNPDLKLERSVQTGFGVEQQLTEVLELEAEVYYMERRRLANFTNELVMREDGTFRPLLFVSTGRARGYGLEVLLRHDITPKFYGWISYTLSRSLEQRTRDDELVPAAFDQPHNFILVASRRLGTGWEVGARLRMTSGRPETPVLGGVFDADEGDFDPIRPDDRFGGRRAFFHQLDLRVEKMWRGDTWDVAAYLDVMNVYNAENPEATQWDYRFRNSAPVRGMPIVPTLGVKGTW